MPIETADDLASFFATDEFGEAITFEGVGGLSALWFRPGDPMPFGQAMTTMDEHRFVIASTSLPAPENGHGFTVDRSGETFTVTAEPYRSRDGALWILTAA